jgi:hypothetical protein
MAKSNVTFNDAAWDELVRHVIKTEGEPRMQRVADACNADLGEEGYMMSSNGDEPLTKRDFRATVITANAHAMRDNAKNNTLIHNFHLAGGD